MVLVLVGMVVVEVMLGSKVKDKWVAAVMI